MSKGTPNPRREELRALSASIRPLVKAGQFDSVNEGLVALYTEQTGQSEWHTFADWRKAGRPVKKGEHGFPIWGQPRSIGEPGAVSDGIAAIAAVNGIEVETRAEFFPVCYLFHAGQVDGPATNPTPDMFQEAA